MAYRLWNFPQDKIYVITDWSVYVAGDTYDNESATLLWRPQIKLSDNPVVVAIPNSAKGQITVNIQGVDADGMPISIMKKM